MWVYQVALVVNNLPANAGVLKEAGLTTGLGRSPGGGNGHPLQYSCLENSMDRGAWQATYHGVTKSWTQLKQLSTTHTYTDTQERHYKKILVLKFRDKCCISYLFKRSPLYFQAYKLSYIYGFIMAYFIYVLKNVY